MLKCFLITDSEGFAFYKKIIDFEIKIEQSLLGGLLSALTSFGNELFKKPLARVYFGEKMDISLTIIRKGTFQSQRDIFFVFIGDNNSISIKEMKKISTDIFIQTKNSLFYNRHHLKDFPNEKINRILEKYNYE
jgi:hypothetical protein